MNRITKTGYHLITSYDWEGRIVRDKASAEKAKALQDKKIEWLEDYANKQDWHGISDCDKFDILTGLADSIGLPYGLEVYFTSEEKHEAVFASEELALEYFESLVFRTEIVTPSQFTLCQISSTLTTASYIAIIAAIITAIHKRNLHRLSVPYPHFDIVPLNAPSFTVQNILAVFEGFSLSIFSRPPPKQLYTYFKNINNHKIM